MNLSFIEVFAGLFVTLIGGGGIVGILRLWWVERKRVDAQNNKDESDWKVSEFDYFHREITRLRRVNAENEAAAHKRACEQSKRIDAVAERLRACETRCHECEAEKAELLQENESLRDRLQDSD